MSLILGGRQTAGRWSTAKVPPRISTGAWQSNHLCGDDRYEMATLVRSRNIVQERWRVRGPITNYEAITIHTRLG